MVIIIVLLRNSKYYATITFLTEFCFAQPELLQLILGGDDSYVLPRGGNRISRGHVDF